MAYISDGQDRAFHSTNRLIWKVKLWHLGHSFYNYKIDNMDRLSTAVEKKAKYFYYVICNATRFTHRSFWYQSGYY